MPTVLEESSLWQKSFGHFNYAALKHLHHKGLTQSLIAICVNNNVCQACQFGNQSKLPFTIKKAWRAIERL